jgi:hypothetical protein
MLKDKSLTRLLVILTILSALMLASHSAVADWYACSDVQYCTGNGCFGDYAERDGCEILECYINGHPSGEGHCNYIFP